MRPGDTKLQVAALIKNVVSNQGHAQTIAFRTNAQVVHASRHARTKSKHDRERLERIVLKFGQVKQVDAESPKRGVLESDQVFLVECETVGSEAQFVSVAVTSDHDVAAGHTELTVALHGQRATDREHQVGELCIHQGGVVIRQQCSFGLDASPRN